MRFMTADFLIPFIGGTAIVVSLSLFYSDFTRKVDAGNKKEVGIITFKRLVAQRKYGKQVVWEEVETNTQVYNNDSIRTAGESDAVIRLNDGTEIKLAENSLIVLSFTKDEFYIQFKKGEFLANRGNVSDPNAKKLNISSADTKVSVTTGNLSLSGEGKDLNITVAKGKANINTAGVNRVLGENQKAIIGGDKMDLVELNLKLITPVPQKYFLTAAKSRKIDFSWENVKGNVDLFFEVSANRKFNRFISRRPVKGTSGSLNLSKGNYYWRLRGINRKTKKTSYSESRRFSIVSEKPVILIAPRNNTVISYKSEMPPVKFKWIESLVASSYDLVIATDPEMKNTLKSISMTGNRLALSDLAKGSYYWRVNAKTRLGGEEFITASKINKLVISQNVQVEPPVLIYPSDNRNINQLVLARKNIIFTWRKNPEIQKTLFAIARDNEFKSVIFSSESENNFNRFQKELPPGKYFWRVTGYAKGDDKAVNSPVRKFTVTKPDKLKLLKPGPSFLAVPAGKNRLPHIQFAWNRAGLKGKYNLQISNNKSFSSIYRQEKLATLSSTIKNFDPGRYFWRVEFYDEEDVRLMTSEVRMVSAIENLSRPEVITPGEGNDIDMSTREALSLEWKSITGADYYKLSLYKVKNGKTYRLINTKVKDSEFLFKEINKLEEGRFYWTLQAVDLDNNRKNATGKIIRRSPLIKNSFNIILKNKNTEDVKNLKLPEVLILK
jgi:hypothetical protein